MKATADVTIRKSYSSPELSVIGSIAEITQGCGPVPQGLLELNAGGCQINVSAGVQPLNNVLGGLGL